MYYRNIRVVRENVIVIIMNLDVKIGKECIQCGKNTLLSCSNCSDPLCKECMNPKEPIEIPFYESSIPTTFFI